MATVSKSYSSSDPVSNYCTELSLRQHPLQVKLQEKTLAEAGEWARMLGAPEVLHFGKNLIQLTRGKRALDIDKLIANGESGKFDFAFIDADKPNYVNYYNKCIELLRSGGVLLIDNALWGGSVAEEEKDESTTVIDAVNRLAHSDDRVNNSLINLGDGTHVIFKK
uniref:Caffeoyl-CoA O-methyltransferase n=1 Tax=Plectus sambesii TaxID=2011161 RepID=A0A914X0T7_9BILA